MGKPNRGNTIKIKLNGENKSFKVEPKKKEKAPDNDSFSKVIKIDPNFKEQDGFFETAAAKDPLDESFNWIIPETTETDVDEYKVINHQKPKKSTNNAFSSYSRNPIKGNGSVVKSIIITAIFAILIGTSFGVIMLKLFNTDNGKPAVTEPVVKDSGSKQATNKPTAGTFSVVIKAETAFVVQGGVFSSKDAAKEGAKQVTEKGAPAQTFGMSDKEYVFLGVAESFENAKQLSNHYKLNGYADVFPKEISFAEKTISEINESEKSFLEAASGVFQQLSKVSTNALITTSISDETVKTVSGLGAQIKQNESKLKNEKVKNLQLDLTTAVEKVKSFQKSKDPKSLVEAQQHLLNFLTVYYSL